MRPVWTFSVFSLQSYSCFRERSFFRRCGGGEGEQTADQVSVNFINLWTSNTTGLLEPPRWKSEPPHWKCGLASEKGLPDPQKMKIWSQKKKSFPKSIWTWTFCKENASKLVKFGLCSSISDLHTPIWGHHPMLYFPSQIQRNIVLCYARVYRDPQKWLRNLWMTPNGNGDKLWESLISNPGCL